MRCTWSLLAARHTHNETPFTCHHKSSRATSCAVSASSREATTALLEVNKGETPSRVCVRSKGPPAWAHSTGLQSFTFKSREPLRLCSFYAAFSLDAVAQKKKKKKNCLASILASCFQHDSPQMMPREAKSKVHPGWDISLSRTTGSLLNLLPASSSSEFQKMLRKSSSCMQWTQLHTLHGMDVVP